MSVWLCDTTLVTHTQTHTQTRTLLYHLPGVGLLWSGQTNESLAVSVCVDCVEVKRVGETAAVKGNRATHLKFFEYTKSLYNCNHYMHMHSHYDTHQCPYHLHVVDQCLQQTKLVLTANTTNTAHKHHTTSTPTLSYIAQLTGGGLTDR